MRTVGRMDGQTDRHRHYELIEVFRNFVATPKNALLQDWE